MMKKLLAVFLAVALGVSLVTPVVAEESTAEKTYAAMQELFRAWPDVDIEAALTEEQLALTLGEVLNEEQVTALDEILTEAERTFPQEEEAVEEPVPEEPMVEEPIEPETPGEGQEEGGEPEPQAVPSTETKDTAALTVGELFAILQAREPEAAAAVLAVLVEEEEEPVPEEPLDPEEPTTPEEPATPPAEKPTFDVAEAYDYIMGLEDEDEIEAYLQTLTEEQMDALDAYAESQMQGTEIPELNVISTSEIAPLVSTSSEQEYRSQGFPFASPKSVFASYSSSDNENTTGLIMNKKAERQDDGSYKLTLEAYVTGAIEVVSSSKPADIVLVLDVSGSMDDKLGNETKLDALKKATQQFVDAVAEKAKQDGVNHRISVVKFAGKKTDELGNDTYRSGYWKYNYSQIVLNLTNISSTNTIKTAIEGLMAGGATSADYGMQHAQTILNGIDADRDSNKVVIMFTDGEPNHQSGFDESVANSTIKASKQIKNTGATIYTIGVFNNANDTVPMPTDSSNMNRYMHYVSSNFKNASSMTNPGAATYPGNNKSYYKAAGNAGALSDIFQSISQQIGGASMELGSSTEVRDVISPYFEFDTSNSKNIQVYTADYKGYDASGNRAFESKQSYAATVTPNGNTISVTNFDFSSKENCVTDTTNGNQTTYSGKKLIIEIPIKVRDGFWGGNGVPTNGDTSGIYSGETAVKKFEVPTVDVPIKHPEAQAVDKNVYYGGDTPTASDLYTLTSDFPTTGADAWKTDFVTLEESIGEQPISNTQDGTYIVTVKVKPKHTGTERETSTEVSATVNVFKPTVTWKDTTIEAGASANYQDNLVSVKWYHDDVDASTVNMVGTAPELEYTYSPAAGQFQQDTEVIVTVSKVGDTVISNNSGVTFAWSNSEGCNCTEGPQNAHFRVHVNVPSFDLTITKHIQDGSRPDQDFVFNVTDGDKTYTVVIRKEQFTNGSATAKIKDLPNGTYTVTEETGWSWRYTLVGSNEQTVNKTNNSVSFENKRDKNNWLSGSSNAVNNWLTTKGLKGGNAS